MVLRKMISKISFNSHAKRKAFSEYFLPVTIIIILSMIYLLFAWNRYKSYASSEALILAQTVESLLHPEHIADLSGSEEDINDPDYQMIKSSFIKLIKASKQIRFVYLIALKDNNLVILVDSENVESSDYSPPGQIYEEADEILFIPFVTGEPVLTGTVTDRWGKWISALVPVKDPESGGLIAIVGIDYSSRDWYINLWKRMIPDMAVSLCVILLFMAFLLARSQNIALKQLSAKLYYDEALFHSVFNQAPMGIAIVNNLDFTHRSDLGHENMNPVFMQILGRNSSELMGLKWPDITHPDDLEEDLVNFNKFKSGEIDSYSMEKRFLKPDGTYVWTNMKISRLFDVLNKNSMHLCLLEDISSRKHAEGLLKESERSKSVLLSHLPGLAYRCRYDRNQTMLFVSDGCYELTGYYPENLLYNRDLSFNDIIAAEYKDIIWHEWKKALDRHIPFTYEYEIITADKNHKWVLELGEGIYDKTGRIEALEGIIIDISDRRRMEEILRYNNEHDKWTGLYNRNYLEDLLNNASKNDTGLKRALIGINLSAVHSLTSTYGFNYTRDLMKRTADILNGFNRDNQILFNTYPDQFVFYIEDYENKDDLKNLCRTIGLSLDSILRAERISAGIGVIEIMGRPDADLLLKNLLIASENAINLSDRDFKVCFYDHEMEIKVRRREEIKAALTRIADNTGNEGLFLQYQPILDLKDDKIIGFEALARLNLSEYGLIPPLEFIPIAEETKLIIPIGRKIIYMALGFLFRLKEAGYEKIDVSINVSALQLQSDGFTTDLIEIINEMNVRPENIGIEITESVLALDYIQTNKVIAQLKKSGIKIAIDDFGTGYSSLARERELDVDCLKIDKYFIDNLMDHNTDKLITKDIISMAHKMGHCAIAEGVEHEFQKTILQEFGCDKIQGFLVGKPLDEFDAINLLKNVNVDDFIS